MAAPGRQPLAYIPVPLLLRPLHGAGGDERGSLRREPRRDHVVRQEQWRSHASGGAEGAERVRTARHAGERLGVGAGLVRPLSGRFGDGSSGSRFGLVPGVSGRWLGPRCRALPVGESRRRLARRPQRRSRLSPAEDILTLCTFTLLHCEPRRQQRRAGNCAAGRGSARAERRTDRPGGIFPGEGVMLDL